MSDIFMFAIMVIPFTIITTIACIFVAKTAYARGYEDGNKIYNRHQTRVKKLEDWKKERKKYMSRTIKG